MLSYFAISFILAMALAPSLINGLTRLEWWKKKHKSVASTGEKLTVIKKFTQKVEGDRKVPVSGGILIWGKQEKAYRKGTKVRIPRPQAEWTTIAAPELRIVDEATWAAAHAQIRPVGEADARRSKGGRPPAICSPESRAAPSAAAR